MPLLNYPDVCTSPCAYGKAFCKDHCTEVEKAGYPTDVRGFLKACRTKEEELDSMFFRYKLHIVFPYTWCLSLG